MHASVLNKGANFEDIRIACLALYDFCAAFPSVAHQWLFIVLDKCDAPEWFKNFVKGLYSVNNTYHMNSHGMNFLYPILCGVLQGCPLSATLFLLCINPFLVHFEEAFTGKYSAHVRCCADDIGIAFADFRTLKVAHKVFKCAKDFANLTLGPAKCNLVPLNQVDPSFQDGERERDYIHSWLETHIPDWRPFQVLLTAKYLGFHLGPKSSKKVWDAPIANHELATLCYNSRAVPVLGYVGQLLPLQTLQHKNLMLGCSQVKRTLLHHLFHLPTNSWDGNMFYELGCIGLNRLLVFNNIAELL